MEEINMIRKLAWSFHKTTGEDFEELFSETCVAWEEAKNNPKYDPRKSAISSFAWQQARDHLKNYLKKQYHDIGVNKTPSTPFEEVSFKEQIENLSDEARYICKQILTAPQEYLEHSPKNARSKIKNEMREAGYSWSQIWNSFRELKSTLNE